jgi:hypothetical protein
MNGKVSSTHQQRLLLSAHLGAGVAAILLSVPLVTFLNRSEPIGVALTAVLLGLIYGILFLLYRALGISATEHADNSSSGAWVVLVTGIALFLAGATWATWVWLMDVSLVSLGTYIPLLVGCVVLWGALAIGSLIQVKTMRKSSVRVVA